MKKMKKNLTLLIVFLVFIVGFNTNTIYADSNAHLLINHIPTTNGPKPIIKNNVTLVPIRVITDSLGADISWNPKTKEVKITTDASSIEMKIGNPNVKVNSHSKKISVPATIYKSSTMLPLRFVGEALNCQVDWDNRKKVASVITPNVTKATAPNFTHDRWNRKVKTTNLPKNAILFPYVAEDVPNWVYESINLTDPALTSNSGIKQLPKDFFNSSHNFDKAVDILNRHFDTVLNLDYRTIDRNEFKSYVNEVFSDKSFAFTGFPGSEWADTYVDYVVDNKITTTGSAIVLPEMFWLNNSNEIIVSAWVNLEVTNKDLIDSRLVFQDFGNFPISNTPLGVFPTTKVNQTYQGLVQFKMFGYKIDYKTNSIINQIHPLADGFGGAYIGQ